MSNRMTPTSRAILIGTALPVALAVGFGGAVVWERRKGGVPDVRTSAASPDGTSDDSTHAVAETPPETQAVRVQRRIVALWAAYDALPTKTKPELLSTVQRAVEETAQLPGMVAAVVRAQIMISARERMAPLVLPETRATGSRREVLVPSEDHKCPILGSSWVNEDETLEAIVSLGFERIECKDKSWDLNHVRNTCYLYSKKTAEQDGQVILWKDLKYFAESERFAHRTDEEALVRYMALVSAGAQLPIPGAHFIIEERGATWLRVAGQGIHAGMTGYVEPGGCQRKPLSGAK